VLQAALEVVADRARPRETRYAAIKVLWYYVTETVPEFGTVLLELRRPRVIVGVGVHNLKPRIGSNPVTGDARQRLIVRLGQLAENPADDPHVLMAIRETIERFR
jgi:hypothetical protein